MYIIQIHDFAHMIMKKTKEKQNYQKLSNKKKFWSNSISETLGYWGSRRAKMILDQR